VLTASGNPAGDGMVQRGIGFWGLTGLHEQL
jgi:hypothetical protein